MWMEIRRVILRSDTRRGCRVGIIICLIIACYLLQEHIGASGGFRNSFTKTHGISNAVVIILLLVYPFWAFIIKLLVRLFVFSVYTSWIDYPLYVRSCLIHLNLVLKTLLSASPTIWNRSLACVYHFLYWFFFVGKASAWYNFIWLCNWTICVIFLLRKLEITCQRMQVQNVYFSVFLSLAHRCETGKTIFLYHIVG